LTGGLAPSASEPACVSLSIWLSICIV
jgi:hypothetical protein